MFVINSIKKGAIPRTREQYRLAADELQRLAEYAD
jgi:hypothetical protein